MALLLKNARLVDPAVGLDAVCDLVIRDGVIAEIGTDLKVAKGETVECAEKIVLPGLADVHAHLVHSSAVCPAQAPDSWRLPIRQARCCIARLFPAHQQSEQNLPE